MEWKLSPKATILSTMGAWLLAIFLEKTGMITPEIAMGIAGLSLLLFIPAIAEMCGWKRNSKHSRNVDEDKEFKRVANLLYPKRTRLKQFLGIVPTQDQLNNRRQLLDLRTEGIGLHNQRIEFAQYAHWHERFENWHLRVLEAAEAVDPELRSLLSPLGDLPNWNRGWAINADHRLAQNMIWETRERIERYLDQTR